MMLMQLVLLSVSGGVGAMLRFLADQFFLTKTSKRWRLPLAQIAVNIIGSFLAGFVASLAITVLPDPYATITLTGLLGGFTTLSASSVATATKIHNREWGAAVLVGAGQLVLSVAAAFLGAGLAFQ